MFFVTTDLDGADRPATRPRRTRRVTSADVARHAGLSRATVSYVLNDTPHQVIPEHTRQRVLAAAAELGYTPSAAARTLSSGRSDVVLLLLPDWPIGYQVGRLLDALSTALAEHRLTLLAHPRVSGRPVTDVWRAVTPAAVVTFEPLDGPDVAVLGTAGVDLTIALHGSRRSPRGLDVSTQRSGRLQAEHLAAAGHRRLGYAWPDDDRLAVFAEARLEGVRQACAELGLADPQVVTVPMDPEGATAAARTWREAAPPATAVCAYNDDVALAVLAGARRLGLDVPGDLAVVGVDDIPAAALAVPALSTVSVDAGATGRYIAAAIVNKLAGRPAPRRPGSDTHDVVVRASG